MYRIHRAVHWAPLDAYIRSLAPAAWFRQGVGITVTGSGVSQWDDQSGNGRHLLQGTDAARPIDLPFSGERYLYLPGMAGNYASTPDSAANSITGDIDIRVRVALDDWTPGAANEALVNKFNGTSGYEFFVWSGAAGRLRFLYGNGVGTVTSSSTAAVSFSDGEIGWARVTRSSSSGDVNFYTSVDGLSWTKLGDTVASSAGSIADGPTALSVGQTSAPAPAHGKIYRAIIKNGIDGTTVVDFNPADADGDGDTSFASSTTGETWTINSSGGLPAQIVGRAAILFNGTSHYLKTNAFTLDQPTCVLMVVNVKAWSPNDRLFDGNAADSVTALQNTSTPKISLNAGVALGPITPPLNELHVHIYVANGSSSSIGYDKNASTTGNAGTNNMGGFTLGARGVGDVPSNIQVYETVIFPIAPSTAQLDRLVGGLMARHGVAG